MSNKLEQLEFKLEKFIGIYKHAGKVRKSLVIYKIFWKQIVEYITLYHDKIKINIACARNKTQIVCNIFKTNILRYLKQKYWDICTGNTYLMMKMRYFAMCVVL